MSGITIDIGIPTYRRPELLKILLESIARLEIAPACRIRVLVCDNDPNGSAFQSAHAARDSLGLDLIYFTEPVQGISQARNCILSRSRGSFLAFLDDDEFVEPLWLRRILDAQAQFDADVVFGPVRGVLPDGAPRWASIHPCFKRPDMPTGTKMSFGGAGNVLIKTSVIIDGKLQFDPSFSTTGGEDVDFFNRLNMAGARMIWCAEALAMEHVPPNRLTLQWVMKRSFRSGQCYARAIEDGGTGFSRMPRIVRKLMQIVIALPLSFVVAPFAPARSVLLLSKIAGAIGEMSVLFSLGPLYEEYVTPNYRRAGSNDHDC